MSGFKLMVYLERRCAPSAANFGILQAPSLVTLAWSVMVCERGVVRQFDAGVRRRESCRHVTTLRGQIPVADLERACSPADVASA